MKKYHYIAFIVFLLTVFRSASSQLNFSTFSQNRQEYSQNYTATRKVEDFDELSQRFGPPYNDEDGYKQSVNYNNSNYKSNSDNSYRSNYYQIFNNYNGNDKTNGEGQYLSELRNLRHYLADIDYVGSTECAVNVESQWNFETNVNEITEANALIAQERYADFQRLVFEEIRKVDRSKILDENLQRQIQLLSNIGPNALPPAQLDRYKRLVNDMLAIHNNVLICGYDQPFICNLKLNPDLKEIMSKSRDWGELQHTWSEFHRKTGKPMRDLFEQLLELTNEIAYLNNFTSGGEYWFSAYESLNFREEVEEVWASIQPLYDLIHAYVRHKLREYYGPEKINRNAPIPAHILGNMYAQTWINIIDLTIPYPGRNFIDVTPEMIQQGYTPQIMFQLAEEFFLSLNMTPLTPRFWIDSLIEKPIDRHVLCQPSAWDFCNGIDFRVKMCTKINHKDLLRVHHEMAHIQYFTNYRHLPKAYRDGANPGFHEAIGEAVSLSVTSSKHLQFLGLLHKSTDDNVYDINFLLALALEKVVFLPFALTLESWRYDIFTNNVDREQMNCHYWYLREKYSGVKPPVLRSEMDFDPGAKYHVAANVPYMKYFFATILQFQIHKAMCQISGQYSPSDPLKQLHRCDIYGQPEAGLILRKIMEKGASQHWRVLLKEVINEDRLDGQALREYFRPLEEWLRNENLRNQEFIGWQYDGDYCKKSIETANLQVYGGFYNKGCIVCPEIFTVFILGLSFVTKLICT